MKKLYEFHWNCGRQGDLDGRFVLNGDGHADLEAAYGKMLYFGEVLGKHSNITGTLNREDIRLVTDDQAFLDMADALKIELSSGFNPLDYLEDNR